MKSFGRAKFSGYRIQPGELAVSMKGAAIEIEVFREAASWRARTLPTMGQHKNISGPLESVITAIAARFETQLTPWRWIDAHGNEIESPLENPLVRHLLGGIQTGLISSMSRSLCGRVIHWTRFAKDPGDATCDQCTKVSDACE